jgi:hypothetical protein
MSISPASTECQTDIDAVAMSYEDVGWWQTEVDMSESEGRRWIRGVCLPERGNGASVELLPGRCDAVCSLKHAQGGIANLIHRRAHRLREDGGRGASGYGNHPHHHERRRLPARRCRRRRRPDFLACALYSGKRPLARRRHAFASDPALLRNAGWSAPCAGGRFAEPRASWHELGWPKDGDHRRQQLPLSRGRRLEERLGCRDEEDRGRRDLTG